VINRRRPPRPRISHAQNWYTWLLILLLLFYFGLVVALELANLNAWLEWISSLAPNLFTATLALMWSMLRHLIPVAVGWWFAYRATVITLERLYDLPDRETAVEFLRRLRSPYSQTQPATPVNPQTLETERAASVLLRVGGPGKVKLEPHMVAVTEINGRYTRVIPAGVHYLRPFEYVHTVLDLRQQERNVTGVAARTRDNIELTAAFNVVYCIRRGDNPPTEARPYPFDEAAVCAAAYAQTVFGDQTAATWEGRPIATVSGKVAATIGRYRLDELMHPYGRTDEPYRTLQREVWRAARSELSNVGIELISVHIDRLEMQKEVEELYIKYWQSRWETQAHLSKVEGEAMAMEEIEIARAEAEVAMIQAILEGIQRARRSGASTRTSDIVALRLIDGLERIAEKSRTSRTALPSLTELRSELTAAATPSQTATGSSKQ
jgi:hypothetical protein